MRLLSSTLIACALIAMFLVLFVILVVVFSTLPLILVIWFLNIVDNSRGLTYLTFQFIDSFSIDIDILSIVLQC